jgi:hypothetical protein
MQIRIDPAVHSVDLTPMLRYTAWHANTQYFLRPPGQEHYRLLAHIATQFEDGSCFADLGTLLGFSALALALNPAHRVLTYDIADWIPNGDIPTAKDVPNIERRLQNCLAVQALADIAACPFIVLDVDPHNGMQETAIIQVLMSSQYQGVVLADDIHLNENMRAFWQWVPQKKIDVTRYGHGSGTGIIIFDPASCDVVVT